MTGWVRREPDVAPGIDWGGDVQVGEAWDARWSRDLGDGMTAFVSRTTYPIKPAKVRELERTDEFMAIRGTAEDGPGGDEAWSEYLHSPEYSFSPTDLGARAAAYAAEAPCDEEWNSVAPEWLQIPQQRRELADDDVDGC